MPVTTSYQQAEVQPLPGKQGLSTCECCLGKQHSHSWMSFPFPPFPGPLLLHTMSYVCNIPLANLDQLSRPCSQFCPVPPRLLCSGLLAVAVGGRGKTGSLAALRCWARALGQHQLCGSHKGKAPCGLPGRNLTRSQPDPTQSSLCCRNAVSICLCEVSAHEDRNSSGRLC